MAGLNFRDAIGANASNVESSDKTPAKVWLNIGKTVKVKNDNGEEEAVFVSIPVGIAIDTQQPVAIRGRNERYNAFVAAKNDLLAQLQEMGSKMEPGEERTLKLEVQLRHVADAAAQPSNEDNMFRVSI